MYFYGDDTPVYDYDSTPMNADSLPMPDDPSTACDGCPCQLQLPTIIASLLGISCLLVFSKDGEDVFSTAARIAVSVVGIVMTSLSAIFIRVAIHVVTSYWLPLMGVVATWLVFPALVHDFVFLLHIAIGKFAEAGQKLIYQLLPTMLMQYDAVESFN